MAHFRFKTELEFEKEYGQKWKETLQWNKSGDMDWLFGRKLIEVINQTPPSVIGEKRVHIKFTDGNAWSIDHRMIVYSENTTTFDDYRDYSDVLQPKNYNLKYNIMNITEDIYIPIKDIKNLK